MTADGIDLLTVEWARLSKAMGGGRDLELAERAFARGLELLGEGRPPERPDPAVPLGRQVPLLRRLFAWESAGVAVHRFTYATSRDRYRHAAEREQRIYERKIALDTEVVPELKAEARELRAEVRRLERQLRSRGADPEIVQPRIEWDRTLAVEVSAAPRFETAQDRRKATIEVFRRLREGR